MPSEIERKFLIDPAMIALPPRGREIRQGYLPLSERVKTAVRVRVVDDDAWLTVKGENAGAVRAEYEYRIPLADACEMLDALCRKPLISKTRYEISHGDHLWEIDIFHGDNEGLAVAEVELAAENENFAHPPWIGEEVTHDSRYYNSNLLDNPYRDWDVG